MLIDFYLVLELCIGSQISDSCNFDHFVTKCIFQIRPVTYVQKYDCKDDTYKCRYHWQYYRRFLCDTRIMYLAISFILLSLKTAPSLHSFHRSVQCTRREIKMTYVTITIVGIFFFLNLPRVFMGGYEVGKMHLVLHCAEYKEDYHPQMWYYKVDNICRFLMVLNSSINFLIYCIGNEQFKVRSQQCYQLFAKHLKKITIFHWLATLKENF